MRVAKHIRNLGQGSRDAASAFGVTQLKTAHEDPKPSTEAAE